ncbi:MAG: FAD-dependent oxidoreductase [Candidatus Magasanikbacteria bacterium]
MKNNDILDLVIIGAAAAGSAAAVYAARRNLNFVVVTKDIGGEVALSGEVENWPGTVHTTGFKLAQDFHEHMKSYNVPIEEGYEVVSIQAVKNYHIVTTKNSLGEKKTYTAKAVIISSGIHPRLLNIPGEKEYYGRGVTYCTVCDGPLYRGKVTATVGGGNSALESALMMAGIATKVYLITKYPNTKENNWGFPKGENILIEKIKEHANIEVIYNANTKEIVNDGSFVSGLIYEDTDSKEEKRIDIQGVMVHVGQIPNSNFVLCGSKNTIGEIEVDTKCKTNCPGIFAAGDVTNVPFKQIAIAAGHGVTAALSAIEYINKWKEEV